MNGQSLTIFAVEKISVAIPLTKAIAQSGKGDVSFYTDEQLRKLFQKVGHVRLNDKHRPFRILEHLKSYAKDKDEMSNIVVILTRGDINDFKLDVLNTGETMDNQRLFKIFNSKISLSKVQGKESVLRAFQQFANEATRVVLHNDDDLSGESNGSNEIDLINFIRLQKGLAPLEAEVAFSFDYRSVGNIERALQGTRHIDSDRTDAHKANKEISLKCAKVTGKLLINLTSKFSSYALTCDESAWGNKMLPTLSLAAELHSMAELQNQISSGQVYKLCAVVGGRKFISKQSIDRALLDELLAVPIDDVTCTFSGVEVLPVESNVQSLLLNYQTLPRYFEIHQGIPFEKSRDYLSILESNAVTSYVHTRSKELPSADSYSVHGIINEFIHGTDERLKLLATAALDWLDSYPTTNDRLAHLPILPTGSATFEKVTEGLKNVEQKQHCYGIYQTLVALLMLYLRGPTSVEKKTATIDVAMGSRVLEFEWKYIKEESSLFEGFHLNSDVAQEYALSGSDITDQSDLTLTSVYKHHEKPGLTLAKIAYLTDKEEITSSRNCDAMLDNFLEREVLLPPRDDRDLHEYEVCDFVLSLLKGIRRAVPNLLSLKRIRDLNQDIDKIAAKLEKGQAVTKKWNNRDKRLLTVLWARRDVIRGCVIVGCSGKAGMSPNCVWLCSACGSGYACIGTIGQQQTLACTVCPRKVTLSTAVGNVAVTQDFCDKSECSRIWARKLMVQSQANCAACDTDFRELLGLAADDVVENRSDIFSVEYVEEDGA